MDNSDATSRMLPPGNKKQRIVDLSYVPLSRGVVFLADDGEYRKQHEPFIASKSMVPSTPTPIISLECDLGNGHSNTPCDDTDPAVDCCSEDRISDRVGGSTQFKVLKQSNDLDDDSSSTRTGQEPFNELKYVDTRFSDIIGHDIVKVRIDELLLPLALPPSLVRSILKGVRALPASILLYGPPGCGKTQLARAIAGESQAAFLSIGPSDVLSKFVGESEASLRALFAKATDLARTVDSRCAVLFFDEIDALGYSRVNESGASLDGDGSRRILAELLIQLSNLSSAQKQPRPHDYHDDDRDDAETDSQEEPVRVMVVAATNRVSDCDPALMRRFAIQIHVGLPSVRDRRKIFRKFLSDFEHCLTKKDLNELAIATEGWSGSDLESLTREASMTPIRECLKIAATAKRKARQMEQQGGVESAQETKKAQGAFLVAKKILMKEFQSLRPVTAGDFQGAMAFLLCNSTSANDVVDSRDSSSDSDSQDD